MAFRKVFNRRIAISLHSLMYMKSCVGEFMSGNDDLTRMFYDLLIAISSLTTLERKIILYLAHIYPSAVSVAQLARAIGYSEKARTLYRGVLQRLTDAKLILLDKLTPKIFSIRINHEHEQMRFLAELCKKHGKELRKVLLGTLKGGEEKHGTD